jgi:MATE family multidrug resistance protein
LGGSEPLAAAVFAGSFFSVFLVMGIGMSFAITPQVAQADGGNNPSRIIEILKHGLLVNSPFWPTARFNPILWSGRFVVF